MIRATAGLWLACLLLSAAAVLVPLDLAAQQADTLVVVASGPSATQKSVELPDLNGPTSPGGAFLRALILPGWGHASIGSYKRGGFYFITESTTAFMLARTIHRIGIAKDAQSLKESRVREALLASGSREDSIPGLLDRNAEVRHTRNLVRARQSQLEDLVAMGLFLLFIGGADAFVSAHLRDFPDPVGIQVAPLPGGTTGIGFSVPIGGPHLRR
jgi:hypothetical protein